MCSKLNYLQCTSDLNASVSTKYVLGFLFISLAAPSMYLSKQQGHVVGVKSTNTIASGLAPPRAGEHQ